MNFLYTKTCEIFTKDYSLKVCTLLMNKNMFQNKKFVEIVNYLFFPITEEDIHALDYVGLSLDAEINNDSEIASMFGRRNIRCIFLFKLISSMYSKLFKTNKEMSTEFIINIYILFSRLTLYIVYNNKMLDKKDEDIINSYNIFIKNENPIEIYVKQRIDGKDENPRFHLIEPTKNIDDLISLEMDYINSPYRVGVFSYDKRNNNVQGELNAESELHKVFMYSYKLAQKQLNIDIGDLKLNVETKNDSGENIETFARKEKYRLGKINGFIDRLNNEYPEKCFTNKFNNNIRSKKDIVIMGYGQSGSGKTSSLISYENKPGWIPRLLYDLDEDINIDEIYVRFIEIYFNWSNNLNRYLDIKDNDYFISELQESIKFVRYDDDKEWKTDDNKKLHSKILEILEKRIEEPTENNPRSSRSHVLICMDFYKNGTEHCKIVLADLAGVENVFTCNAERIILFDKIY